MNAKHELSKVLRGRRDGYWEFVATVVGDEVAVSNTIAGISRDALEANFDGLAISPSIVAQRVESLSAYDEQLLVHVARSWEAIPKISIDLMDAGADFWIAAWWAGLRILKKHSEVRRIPTASIPRPLALELAVLFPLSVSESMGSWTEVHEKLIGLESNYDMIRSLDSVSIVLSEQIGRTELRNLVSSPDGTMQLERLRFFFDRTQLINEEGRQFLEELLDEHWVSAQDADGSVRGIPILLDVVMQLRGIEEPSDSIVSALLSRLRRTDSPGSLLPFVYRLVSPNWRHR